jgi:hypothetical protein
MKRVRCCVLACCVAVGIASNAKAVNLLYDFEGDSGTTATDKLTSDGAQNGTVYNNVSLNDTFNPHFGNQGAFFDNPPALVAEPYSTLEIPGTNFGPNYSVTLAGWVSQDPTSAGPARYRIFSSFSGTGGTVGSLMLDASKASGASKIRGIVNGISFTGPNNVGAITPGYHHYAMTVDGSISGNAAVKLYVDGAPMTITTSGGTLAAGYANGNNLRIAEDRETYPVNNSASEQLVGNADDMLVLNRVLSATDIAALYNGGIGAPVSSIVNPTASDFAVYYDFEGDTGNIANDKFTLDGAQNSTGTQTAMADINAANAKLGNQSFSFTDPREFAEGDDIFSQINAGPVGDLGDSFTLSAVINPYSLGQFNNGVARVFSSYLGTGSNAGQLIVDYNPSTTTGIRVFLPSNTGTVTRQISQTGLIDLDISTKQTLTVVYTAGETNDELKIYLDGVELNPGTPTLLPAGTVQTLGANDLRIGEDRGGYFAAAANENYSGSMDDVMILSRALTAEQVAFLHASGANALLATLTVAGDYNNDGLVNAADYTVWRDSLGQTGTGLAADGDGDNDVDSDDYGIWKSNFGQGGAGAGGAATAAVPEPSTLLIGLMLLIGAAGTRSPRRS